MTVGLNDGGAASPPATDDWSLGGSAALAAHAPAVVSSFASLVGVRPSGVFDELLDAPDVVAFAAQFGADVTGIDEPLRAAFATTTRDHQSAVAQMVWIGDVAPRLRSMLDALFGPSVWLVERRYPVADLWGVIESFTATVARLDHLDPVLTELVRLRGARLHDCRLGRSRRSAAALEAGADEATFDAVDAYAESELPAPARAALALTDAVIRTPQVIPADVLEAVRAHLSPEQAVEVVLDVARNAVNKIAVAVGADAPEVTEGTQLFVTDADGVVTTI